jgi:hypothetical protein
MEETQLSWLIWNGTWEKVHVDPLSVYSESLLGPTASQKTVVGQEMSEMAPDADSAVGVSLME